LLLKQPPFALTKQAEQPPLSPISLSIEPRAPFLLHTELPLPSAGFLSNSHCPSLGKETRGPSLGHHNQAPHRPTRQPRLSSSAAVSLTFLLNQRPARRTPAESQTPSNPQARRPSSLLTRPQQPILLNQPPTREDPAIPDSSSSVQPYVADLDREPTAGSATSRGKRTGRKREDRGRKEKEK